QVDAERALWVGDVDLVRIEVILQPLARRLAVVLVVDPVDHHTRLGQAVEHLVLGLAGRAPGGPDVDQRRALELLLGDQALLVLQVRQAKGRQRLVDQRRRQLLRVEEQAAIKEQRHAEKQQQRQQQYQAFHALASCMPSTSRTRLRTLTR